MMRWLRKIFGKPEPYRHPKFVIRFTQAGQGTEVFIDGKRLSGLTSVRVGTAVDTATTVELAFVAAEVDAEGDGDVIDVSSLDSTAREYRPA